MKTNMFIFALSVFSLFSTQWTNAQNGVNVVTVNKSPAEVFAGKLPKTHLRLNQKLKIDVFGGNWHNNNLGLTTYYIATLDGLRINMERHGGDGFNFQFKVYDNGDYYDFVIARKIDDRYGNYSSFTVESQQIHPDWEISPMRPVAVAAYDPTGKTDITSQFLINIIFATTNDGNVGIGTDCARSKLDVNGTIRAKEVKVELANWSDFVFSPDYELPSLKEVEAHILDKQHLPGIPSEKEVIEKGVDLGKMNALLLQKIEELTLHLIRQEKHIAEQGKRILQLEVDKQDNLALDNEYSEQ